MTSALDVDGSWEVARSSQSGRRFPDLRPELAARIPRLEAGQVIRLRADRAPVRFIWPTTAATEIPFVSVVEGSGGYRYPFYFEAGDVARLLRDEHVVVDAATVPVEAPPHAASES